VVAGRIYTSYVVTIQRETSIVSKGAKIFEDTISTEARK